MPQIAVALSALVFLGGTEISTFAVSREAKTTLHFAYDTQSAAFSDCLPAEGTEGNESESHAASWLFTGSLHSLDFISLSDEALPIVIHLSLNFSTVPGNPRAPPAL